MSDDQQYRVTLEKYGRRTRFGPSKWLNRTVTVEAPSRKVARTRAQMENQGWRAVQVKRVPDWKRRRTS